MQTNPQSEPIIREVAGLHTPGPWKLCHSGYANAPFVIYTGDRAPSFNPRTDAIGRLLPVMSWPEGSAYVGEVNSQRVRFNEREDLVDEGMANARLIAAAPELFEALRELLAEVEDFHESTGHEDEGGIVQCDAICALMPKARAALAKVAP